MAHHQELKYDDDPLVAMTHMVADAIVTIGGPLFWGVLGIGLLTNLFR